MLRVLAVLILSLSVLARASLAIEGEAHEASHLFSAGAEHGAQLHGAELHDVTDDSEAPGIWHKLLHTDHCCGHGVAPVPSVPILRIASAGTEPVVTVGHHYRSRPPNTLHRPPIPA